MEPTRTAERAAAPRPAAAAGDHLARKGVRTVALTWVDNAGITRVKTVPLNRLQHAVDWGVGMSPVFDVFLVDDSITTSRYIGGPAGDLRLFPDLGRLTALAGQPGWAWAPADRRTQDGEPHVACQRTFAQNMVRQAAKAGLTLKMAFEVEWFVGAQDGTPACRGPAYGMTRVIELSAYIDAVLTALREQDVPVQQFHPEYAPGQLELSVGAADPVAAADRNILVRQTIRAVSQQHGYHVSFAPAVVAGGVGNGGHLHLSAVARRAQPVQRRRRAARAHRCRRVGARRAAAPAARAVRDRRAEPGQLPATGTAALGRAVALLGTGEPGGRAALHHRQRGGAGPGGQRRT